MELTDANLRGLYVTYSKKFLQAFAETPVFWDQMALKETITGKELSFPVSVVNAKMRKWLGERVYNGRAAIDYRIGVEPYESSVALSVDDLEDESFGLFANTVSEMARESRRFYNDLVMTALMAGKTELCFDGLPYFSASHPVTPIDELVTDTYQNLFTAKPLTQANFLTVYNYARKEFRDWNNRRLNIRMNELWVGPDDEVAARRICNAPNQATANSGANALTTLSNDTGGWATVKVFEELADEPGVWYLAHTTPYAKPLVLVERKAVEFNTINGKNSETVFSQKKVLFGAEARAGCGYYLPQYCIRVEPS